MAGTHLCLYEVPSRFVTETIMRRACYDTSCAIQWALTSDKDRKAYQKQNPRIARQILDTFEHEPEFQDLQDHVSPVHLDTVYDDEGHEDNEYKVDGDWLGYDGGTWARGNWDAALTMMIEFP